MLLDRDFSKSSLLQNQVQTESIEVLQMTGQVETVPC
jgi:hypothetical protein